MLSQEIKKSLVFARLHIEQTCHDLVVAARLLQTSTDDFTNVRARDFALHEQRIDCCPERLPLINKALVKIVGDGSPALTPRMKRDVLLDPDFRREILDLDGAPLDGHHHPLDN